MSNLLIRLDGADYPRLYTIWQRVKAARLPAHLQLDLDRRWHDAYRRRHPNSRKKPLKPYPTELGEAWREIAVHNQWFRLQLQRELTPEELAPLEAEQQTLMNDIIGRYGPLRKRQAHTLDGLLQSLASSADLSPRSDVATLRKMDVHHYGSQPQAAHYARERLEMEAEWLCGLGYRAEVVEKRQQYSRPFEFESIWWELLTNCANWQVDALRRLGKDLSFAQIGDWAWSRGINPLVWYPLAGSSADALGLSWESYQTRRRELASQIAF
jgi:hypothetical protein